MSVILILILASLTMAVIALAGFFWAVRSGQFEDTCTPSMRVLADNGQRAASTQDALRTPDGTVTPTPGMRSETVTGRTKYSK